MQKQSELTELVSRHFSPAVLDERICREWLLSVLHPGGAVCPGCGAVITSEKQLKTWRNLGRVSCGSCEKFFTAATGTILQGSKLDIRAVYSLALLFGFKVPIAQVARALTLSYSTVENWHSRFNFFGVPAEMSG